MMATLKLVTAAILTAKSNLDFNAQLTTQLLSTVFVPKSVVTANTWESISETMATL